MIRYLQSGNSIYKYTLPKYQNETTDFTLDKSVNFNDLPNKTLGLNSYESNYSFNHPDNLKDLYSNWQSGDIYKRKRGLDNKYISRRNRKAYWDDTVHFAINRYLGDVDYTTRNTSNNVYSKGYTYLRNRQENNNVNSEVNTYQISKITNPSGDINYSILTNSQLPEGNANSFQLFSTNRQPRTGIKDENFESVQQLFNNLNTSPEETWNDIINKYKQTPNN